MGTPMGRYQVLCGECGVIECFYRKQDAINCAMKTKSQCPDCPEEPIVFDLMARKNAVCEWNRHGGVVDWRRD